MTVMQLADGVEVTVDTQSDRRIGMYVRDPDAAGTADEVHGFLLTPTQALGTAEELMATAGEIVGDGEVVTIWAETVTGGVGVYAGERHAMLAFADRDHRHIRIAFNEAAIRDLLRLAETILAELDPPTTH